MTPSYSSNVAVNKGKSRSSTPDPTPTDTHSDDQAAKIKTTRRSHDQNQLSSYSARCTISTSAKFSVIILNSVVAPLKDSVADIAYCDPVQFVGYGGIARAAAHRRKVDVVVPLALNAEFALRGSIAHQPYVSAAELLVDSYDFRLCPIFIPNDLA